VVEVTIQNIMAKIASAPQRFTHEEWVLANNGQYSTAEQSRARAERLRAETDRLIAETGDTTNDTQEETTKRLDQRVGDVTYWNNELDREKTEVGKEIEQLLDYKKRIENSLSGFLDRNRNLTKKCLQLRENRKGIDLVHDEVQKELIKEIEMIQGVEGLLQRTLEQTEEQIRQLRSANYYLEKDLNDKFSALNIDGKCLNLKNGDYGVIGHHPGSAKIVPNSVTPDDWQRFTDENIKKAERNRAAGVNLRAVVDSVLEQTREDLEKQAAAVDAAFRRRIAETEKALDKSVNHHAKVMEEIADVEESIAKLENAIAEKEAPLMVAETRLDERTGRPNVELCRDAPQYRLIGEVAQIQQNIARLRATQNAAKCQLKELIRTQLSLEEDIDVKKHTLEIDHGLCVPTRQQVDHPVF
jgi:tektin-1